MNFNAATLTSPSGLLNQHTSQLLNQNTPRLLRLCLLLMLLCIASPSFSKSFDCRYQLSNWSDKEARSALKQWTANDSQPPIVQYGTVLTDMPPSQCKAFKRWLANAEMLKSSYQLTLYYGKHPKKQLDNNKLLKTQLLTTQSDKPQTHSWTSQQTRYRLSPGVELNINQQLWREGTTSSSPKTSAIYINIEQQDRQTDKKGSATITPLSRKPASQSPNRWLSITPANPKEPRFSFTVFIKDQSSDNVSYKNVSYKNVSYKNGSYKNGSDKNGSDKNVSYKNDSVRNKKIFVRIQQWQFDTTQEQWLETRAKRKVVALNQWHSLEKFFAAQDKSIANNRISTTQRSPHAKYHFYIDRPQ